MDHADEIQAIKNLYEIKLETARGDIRFYQIALNVTGLRKEAEEKAAELIKKRGALSAYILTGNAGYNGIK